MDYVFAWCTDFREDDPQKYLGSKTVRKILEKTPERVIWAVRFKDGKGFSEGVWAVWLNPPKSWHLDTCGDGREVGDYKPYLHRQVKDAARHEVRGDLRQTEGRGGQGRVGGRREEAMEDLSEGARGGLQSRATGELTGSQWS